LKLVLCTSTFFVSFWILNLWRTYSPWLHKRPPRSTVEFKRVTAGWFCLNEGIKIYPFTC
jgi:hypothetical protein